MDGKRKYSLAFALAVMLHLVIIGMFAFSFESSKTLSQSAPEAEIIKAAMVDEEKVMQEAERLRQQEKDQLVAEQQRQKAVEEKVANEEKRLEQIRKKSLEDQKKAEQQARELQQAAEKEKLRLQELQKQKDIEAAKLAKLKEEKLAEEKKVKELEEQRKQAAEIKRQEEQKRLEEKKKAEQEAQRKKAEAAKRQAAEQKKRDAEAKRKAETEAKRNAKLKAEQAMRTTMATNEAITIITRKIKARWIRPATVPKGLSCIIKVKLFATGDVMNAMVSKSSGNAIFDRSAENAARKSVSFPPPASDPNFFAKSVNRILEIHFQPDT